jgi:cytochrome c oxidase cbb3-type subunit III
MRACSRQSRHAIIGVLAVTAFAGAFWYLAESASTRALLRADLNGDVGLARLMQTSTSRGRAVFRTSCVSCHGPGGEGDPGLGVPNLRDQDWLFGTGSPAEIERIVAYGIRSHHPKAWNLTAMPAYASAAPLQGQSLPSLTPTEISDLVEYLVSLSGRQADVAGSDRGKKLFTTTAGCSDCHAADGRGDASIGAPNLTDQVWLYSDGSRAAITDSISHGHQGVCPAQVNRLSAAEIREVVLYVYSLSHPAPFDNRVD